jgi:hypothetical protein
MLSFGAYGQVPLEEHAPVQHGKVAPMHGLPELRQDLHTPSDPHTDPGQQGALTQLPPAGLHCTQLPSC